MEEIIKFLTENPVQYLATVGVDGKAKCRPFMFCFEKDKKLWFCTSNKKKVYEEMSKNPFIEICISNASYSWLRLSGKATFKNEIEIKKSCFENPIVKEQYKTIENPSFQMFYLENIQAIIADMSGNLPKKYTF
ncbi:pyridoxamine 5'-phosphate oxidase family protein [Fusobacterium sp. SYSU M8D902]|uniref:pyridoxamine 5'-phosphate oxidase family protein n=1 Tax=Fusobacterium sp. SYSU M8D902 TaxID=3159562 RepID=UPI0032E4FF9E